MIEVWLNGRFVARDEAAVSVFDAGFQHGVGLFETMSAHHGRVLRASRHVRILAESAASLLLTERLEVPPLVEAVRSTVSRNGLEEARIRLTVTGGDLNLLQSEARRRVDPTILIVAQPPTVYPPAFFETGVTATIADGRDNPFLPTAGHKTLNYWPRIHALQAAAARSAGEALWFTVSNHLAGGSVSNVFLVHGGHLLTPIARGEEQRGAIASAVRPGVTREAICELAERAGIELSRRMLDIEDLLASDEVFLTNSSWGVLPVVQVERERIGSGAVGPFTARLRQAWLQLVADEAEDAEQP